MSLAAARRLSHPFPAPLGQAHARCAQDEPVKNHANEEKPADVALRAEGLCKSYGYRRVLRDVSLELMHGDTLAVIGANGAGKSTLMRMLAGLLRPSRGRVIVESGGCEALPESRRRLVSLTSPAIAPYLHLTLSENIAFMMHARGASAPPGCEEEIARLVGLAERRNDPVASFSSGMVQRTRLAVAIATSPSVLLLDEPTHCLDRAGREVVRGIVEHQRGRGMCIIATNDSEDAALCASTLDLDRYQA